MTGSGFNMRVYGMNRIASLRPTIVPVQDSHSGSGVEEMIGKGLAPLIINFEKNLRALASASGKLVVTL